MGKVITSAGLNEFISSGKVDEVKNAPRAKIKAEAPPLEVEKPPPAVEPGKSDAPPPADAPAEEVADDEATKEATAASEALREAINKKNATINRKHREMKEAQEAARDAEEFAKAQWNEKRLADERAQALEKELTELKGKAVPAVAAVSEAGKPDPQKFYDDKGQFKAFEYAEALAAFSSEQAVKKFEAKQLEERRAQETKQAEEFARTRVQAAMKAHPDFEEVTRAADVKTHPMLISYLSASEQLGEVSYYLAKNPEYLARINAMNPLKAIAEIGVLEKSFEKTGVAPPATEAATQKITPGAPAPIKPLSQAAAVQINTDPAKMTYKELRAYEKQRLAQKMRR